MSIIRLCRPGIGMKCLVLDAMGVIFASADDVADLLIPFIADHGGTLDQALIQSAYLDASLGRIDASTFWQRVDVDASLEDDYLRRFQLVPGLVALLQQSRAAGLPVWCLSNDVGSWSRKLRQNFGLEPRLAGAIISSEVGLRKPDIGIYQILLQRSGFLAQDLLFVDDRDKNVSAALDLGIDSLLFDAASGFDELQARISVVGSL